MTREETIQELGEWLEQMIQHGVPSHSAKRRALATAIALLSAEAVEVKADQLPPKVPPDWINDGMVLVPQHDWIETQKELEKYASTEAVQGWIPFTRRPMTEEEQEDYPNCTFIFDCVLPDDGEGILVSNGRFVWMDTFCNDIDGCYLDSGDDIDEDMAWMPLPKPYKGGEDE